jgi:VIT1/CCC1 family predicted Fe2+/Mn2+ transporter
MKNIDDRIIQVENRIFRKISHLLIIWFGGVFLIFALLFFLIEYLGWSNAVAFFSIGITVFIIGLLLQLGDSNRRIHERKQ